MMTRRPAVAACSALACVVWATPASAALASLLGKSFVVKDSSAGADATRRRVVATAKEKASSVPLVGDPTVAGGALAIEAGPNGQVVDLPASGWRAIRGGYRYADRDGVFGPVQRAVLRRDARGTFALKVVMSGAHASLAIVPPNPGTEGAFAIVVHDGDAYCAHFGGVAGGTVVNDGARLFKVQRPTATGPCPSSVNSTTPPTTSTSTTSTTTTTIVGPPCGEVLGPASCWGECPPETPTCADVGGTCQCVSGTQPCGGLRASECDGACPAGEVCVSGGLDCACMPAGGTPCFTGFPNPPTCGGFCPPDETCVFLELPSGSGCVCAPPTCFGVSLCTASCPPGRGCEAVFIPELGTSCLCMP